MNTIAPLPSAVRAAKRAGKIPAITLPNGRRVTIKGYVKAWKKLVQICAEGDESQTFSGFDYFPMPADELLQKFSEAANDRINIRGRIRTDWPPQRWERIRRHLERTVQCACNWCGQPLPAYQPKQSRFCEASCWRAYSH